MGDVHTQWVVLGLVRNNIEGEEWEKECSRQEGAAHAKAWGWKAALVLKEVRGNC